MKKIKKFVLPALLLALILSLCACDVEVSVKPKETTDSTSLDDTLSSDVPDGSDEPDDTTGSDTPVEPDDTTDSDTPVEPDDTTGSDTPVEPDDTTGSDTPVEPDDTTNSDTPDEPDDTTGSDTPVEPDDTTNSDTPDEPDDTTGGDTPDEPDDTTGSDTPDEPDDTTGSDTPDEPVECVHQFSDWAEIKAPTCTEKGLKTRTCTLCWSSESEAIDAPGHGGEEWIVDVDATCTTPGTKHLPCQVCGETLETATIDATGHTGGEWVTDTSATCLATGTRHLPCLVCGETIETATIELADHTYGEWVETTAPNCIEEGIRSKICTLCKHTENDYVDALGHDVVAHTIREADCLTTGLIERKCSRCVYEEADEIVAALGHDFVNHECQRCDAITYSEGLEMLLNPDGVSYSVVGIGNCEDRILYIPPTHKELPVTMIGSSAFFGNKLLKRIVIPNSVTQIGELAFRDCTEVTEIILPDSITGIGREAFRNCKKITEISLPAELTQIPAALFYDCLALETITIPESVTTIGENAFRACKSLWYADIGNGVQTIEFEAFRDCYNLVSLKLGTSLESLDTCDFYFIKPMEIYNPTALDIRNCVAYDTMLWNIYEYIDLDTPSAIYVDENGFLFRDDDLLLGRIGDPNTTALVLPDYDGYDYGIVPNAFSQYEKLTDLTIPANVLFLSGWDDESFSFSSTASIQTLRVSDIETWLRLGSQIPVTQTRQLYLDGTLVTSLSIPDGITRIGSNTFANFVDLVNVTIPDSVTSIGADAFYGCDSLMQVEHGVSYVDQWAISYSGSYTTVSLRTGTAGIADSAFADNQDLLTVGLPTSLLHIGNFAFENCTNLNAPTLPHKLQTIDYCAFRNCAQFSNVVIPKSVVSIDFYAFNECDSLNAIFYVGTYEEWEASFGFIPNGILYCYSEAEPTEFEQPCGYWRYVNGTPTPWIDYTDESLWEDAFTTLDTPLTRYVSASYVKIRQAPSINYNDGIIILPLNTEVTVLKTGTFEGKEWSYVTLIYEGKEGDGNTILAGYISSEWLSSSCLFQYEDYLSDGSSSQQGDLMIVNSEHPFEFDSQNTSALLNINANIPDYNGLIPYRVSSERQMEENALLAFNTMMLDYIAISGDQDILISSAYRSYEEQESLNSTVPAGYSEHHTGYCIALSVASTRVAISPKTHEWFYANAAQYGFIVRYPAEKGNATGVTNYENCFRYVGIPHATYISENQLCLEEYIQLLKENHPLDNELYISTADGNRYAVYYEEVAGTYSTVSVPTNYEYSISGTNEGGIIVTIDLHSTGHTLIESDLTGDPTVDPSVEDIF